MTYSFYAVTKGTEPLVWLGALVFLLKNQILLIMINVIFEVCVLMVIFYLTVAWKY